MESLVMNYSDDDDDNDEISISETQIKSNDSDCTTQEENHYEDSSVEDDTPLDSVEDNTTRDNVTQISDIAEPIQEGFDSVSPAPPCTLDEDNKNFVNADDVALDDEMLVSDVKSNATLLPRINANVTLVADINDIISGKFSAAPAASDSSLAETNSANESSKSQSDDDIIMISDEEDSAPEFPRTDDAISSIVIYRVETISEDQQDNPSSTCNAERLSETSISEATAEETEATVEQTESTVEQTESAVEQTDSTVEQTESSVADKDTEQKKVNFKCGLCPFTTKTRFSLGKHSAKHKQDETDSDTVKNTIEKVTEIVKSTHSRLSDINKSAESVLNKSSSLKKIDGSILNKSPSFKCKLCKFSTNTRFSLARHTDKHKPTKTDFGGVAENEKANQSIKTISNKSISTNVARKVIQNDSKIVSKPSSSKPSSNMPVFTVKFFKCTYCLFSSKTRFGLKRHIDLVHRKNKKLQTPSGDLFKCDLCSFKNSSKISFRMHLIKGHKNDVSKCFRCASLVPRQYKNEHLLTCNKTKKNSGYECSKCSYKTAFKKSFLWHRNRCEKGLTSKNSKPNSTAVSSEVLKCNLCPYENECHKSLFLHLLQVHKSSSSKCLGCDQLVPLQWKKRHLLLCHRTNQSFDCSKCTYKTAYSKSFLSHAEKCMGELGSANEQGSKLNAAAAESEIVSGKRKRSVEYFGFSGEYDSDSSCLPNKKSSSVTSDSQEWDGGQGIKKGALFSCKYCSFSSNIKQIFFKHLLLHTKYNRPILTCSECEFRSTKHNMRIHLKKAHNRVMPNIRSCDFCSFTTKQLAVLKYHVKLHTVHNKPILSCPECDYKSTYRIICKHSLATHGKRFIYNKKSREKDEVVYRCKYCKFKTKFAISLKQHQVLHNSKVVPGIALERHVEEQKVENRPEHGCDYCSYSTVSKGVLQKHLSLHTVYNKPIKACPYCDYKSIKACLTKHLQIAHHRPTKLKCELCSFTAASSILLARHLRLHTTYSLFKCPKCEYKSTKRNISHHYRKIHGMKLTPQDKLIELKTGNNKVTREDKSMFRNQAEYSMQRHVLTHTRVNKPIHKSTKHNVAVHGNDVRGTKLESGQTYRCRYCSYIAKTAGCLKKHTLWHTKVRNPIYRCNRCNFKGLQYNVISHCKTVHGVKLKIRSFEESNTTDISQISEKNHSSIEEVNVAPSTNQKNHTVITTNKSPSVSGQNHDVGTSRASLYSPGSQQYAYYDTPSESISNCSTPSTNDATSSNSNSNSIYNPTNTILFVCEICDYVTNSKDALIRHKFAHSDAKIPSFQAEQQHPSATKQKSVEVKTSEVKTKGATRRRAIVKGNVFECSNCERQLSNLHGFALHVCEQNNDVYSVRIDGRKIFYQCRICPFESLQKTNILKHVRNYHPHDPSKRRYQCSFCDFKSDKVHVNHHKRTYHSEMLDKKRTHQDCFEDLDEKKNSASDETESVTYKCDSCDFQTNLEDHLRNHSILHININELTVYKNKTYNVGIKRREPSTSSVKENFYTTTPIKQDR